MKNLLVTYHPYEGSFNEAIAKAIEEATLESGSEWERIDLAKIPFDPILTKEELYEFSQARTSRGVNVENLDPVAVEFAAKVAQSNHLILVFPLWWELMPAPMKGFIDKVVFPEILYRYENEFSLRLISENLKRVTIITTMNTPRPLYRWLYKNCIKSALVNGTFKKIGIRKVRWIGYGQIRSAKPPVRQKILGAVKRTIVRSASAR